MKPSVHPSALVFALALLLVGWLWLREHDARVREAAAAQRSQDSLVAAVAAVRAEAATRHTADSLATLRAVRERDAALARARAEAVRTADSLGKLLVGLAAAAPDTLRPLLYRILAEWTAHLDADLQERSAADSAIAERDARYVALEATYAADLAAVNRQLDEALRQLRAANARARPGLLRRAVMILPWAAGAYAAGRLSR